MIGGLLLVAVGIINAVALAYAGHRHNRRYDAAREGGA